jgi:hypothetical protein
MPSIFEAATLIVYKIPGPGHDTISKIHFMIRALYEEDQVNIRGDFQITRAEGQGAAHITLPLAVHEADHDAWEHLDHLRQKLCEKHLECYWATSLTGDRSRALSYVLSVVTPDEGSEMPLAKKSRRDRFDKTYNRLHGDDPRLSMQGFRVAIINAALVRNKIRNVETDWAYDKLGEGKHKGNITLDSRVDVGICLENPLHHDIVIDGSTYRIHFGNIFGLITPTTCTTIGIAVAGDNYDFTQHVKQLRRFMEDYNLVNDSSGTIDNIRMSTENPRYLLCDPSDIITAQGLCELPMPNRRFFRQIFFANAKAANYKVSYGIQYDKEATTIHDTRSYNSPFDYVARSGSLIPLTIDIDPKGPYHNREKPSLSEDLRERRLKLVFEWLSREKKNDPMNSVLALRRLVEWNVELTNQMEPRAEHEWDSQKLFQQDSDALEIQVELHERIALLDQDYQSAKSRLGIVSKILHRLQLKQDMFGAGFKIKPRVIMPKGTIVLGPDGNALSGGAAQLEYEKQNPVGEEGPTLYERLKAQLAEAITNDPDYEHPISESDEPSTSTSSITPLTPSDRYQIISPVAGPYPRELAIRFNEVETPLSATRISVPGLGMQSRDAMMARSAPSTILYSRTNQFQVVSSAEIERITLAIEKARMDLKPFLQAPQNLPCDARDDILSKMNELQSQLNRLLGIGGSESSERRAGTSSRSPLPLNIAPPDADIKPKIEVGLGSKPVVFGGNRWASLQPRPIINGVDPRRRGMDADKKPEKEEFTDAVKRFKVCYI